VTAKIDVRGLSSEELDAATATLKLLADRTRLHIVWALLHGEHSVGELAAHVGVAPAAVSQHLAKLRLARLVRTRRDGNHIFYAAENEHILRLVTEALFHADHVTSASPAHHRVRKPAAS
jgi:DNA-binding transcriptional ArsR family regulator